MTSERKGSELGRQANRRKFTFVPLRVLCVDFGLSAQRPLCPSCDRTADVAGGPFATSRHRDVYSITSSARADRVGGTSIPSAFAVLRLITSSNFVDRSIGRSPGLSPLRMRAT